MALPGSSTYIILQEFKKVLISFVDELIGQFPKEADFVILRIFLKDQSQVLKIMNDFVRKLLPLKQKVVDRNEEFFLNSDSLFEQFSRNKVNHFKRLWRAPTLDDEDKNVIWSWFDSFIYLAEKYSNATLANCTKKQN